MNPLQYKFTLLIGDSPIHVRIANNFGQNRHQWVASRHCNAEYELHILLKGKIPVEVEEQHFVLESRQGIFISPGQYHIPLSAKEQLDHFSLSFSFGESTLADLLHREIPSYKLFYISTEMLQECLALFYEYNAHRTYCNEKIQALLMSLFVSLFRTLNLNTPKTGSRTTTEIERTEIIDDFFAEHLQNLRRADELAEQLCVSTRQLDRILYQLYGMSFQEKITHTKMDRAAWLLRTSDKKIDEIAEAIGYASEAAFYQAFRKYFHITPKKYRMEKKSTEISRA